MARYSGPLLCNRVRSQGLNRVANGNIGHLVTPDTTLVSLMGKYRTPLFMVL